MTQAHFTLLSGDGIGPEVMAEAEKIIAFFNDSGATQITTQHALIGGAAYEACGEPLPQETLDAALRSDAVLLACVGGPQWASVAYDKRPEAGLLAIRKQMDLFANLRPAKVFDALVDASTLKREVVEGLDILIVRELTGGVYFGQPRGIETLPNGERRGVNTQVYTTSEIRRVAAVAFEMARLRDGRVTSAEKSNVMESGLLWREEVTKLHAESYSDVALSHMYADNLAMQLCRAPKQFDVIVTDNLFGDILSDEASMLTGSLGMLPSASLGAIDSATGRRRALYEPVHGSAPDIAGQGKANPLAMLLSLAMAYRYSLGRDDLAVRLEQAIERVLTTTRTADIVAAGFTAVSTAQMGDAVVAALRG